MPDFATAFTVKGNERNLTHDELIRAIRLSIADEYEAIQVYTQIAGSTDNELVKAVLFDIADEEKVHAGEFLRLLSLIAPDEPKYYEKGAAEVDAQVTSFAG